MIKYNMNHSTKSIFLLHITLMLFLTLLSAGCASVPNNLIIKKMASYQDGIDVRENIRKECELEERLPLVVEAIARRYYDHVSLLDEVASSPSDKVLTITITKVIAEERQGILSGRRSIVAKGVLTQNGHVIGNFTDFRESGGAMFTGYRGVCYLLNRSAKAIGKDVGKWLAKPRMNAKLGKAKRLRD